MEQFEATQNLLMVLLIKTLERPSTVDSQMQAKRKGKRLEKSLCKQDKGPSVETKPVLKLNKYTSDIGGSETHKQMGSSGEIV
jgi:hypothetical protein